MTRKYRLRSTLFNLAFYGVTALGCIALLPGLLLPRKDFLHIVKGWLHTVAFLERNILGLRYEIRGREHLPESGPYIVAAKHQSPYETMKLHLLFGDPAIILKKELLRIPLWGWYLKKSDVIAIDRGTPQKATESIRKGALHVQAQGRPIVIFPQGTRVPAGTGPEEKPYKSGVLRIQEATGLPVIPMALNTGWFWPRSGWYKRPGTAIFEFLPPLRANTVTEQNRTAVMQQLAKSIEDTSDRLTEEARKKEMQRKAKSPGGAAALLLIALLFAAYSLYWFRIAGEARRSYLAFMQDTGGSERSYALPDVTGYPGPVRLSVGEEYLQNPQGSLKVESFEASGWPFPGFPVHFSTGALTVNYFKWKHPLHFESLEGTLRWGADRLEIAQALLKQDTFESTLTGTVHFREKPYPQFDMTVTLRNEDRLLLKLTQLEMIEPKAALFAGAGFKALARGGIVTLPVTQRNDFLYLGPVPAVYLPVFFPPAPRNPPAPAR